MSWKVIASVCLLVLQVSAFPGFNSTSATNDGSPKCTKFGMQCSEDKKQVQFCPTADGKFDPIPVQKCEEKEKEQCSQDGTGKVLCTREISGLHFSCLREGEYPDVKDPTKSYICKGNGDPIPEKECQCKDGKRMSPGRRVRCVYEAEGQERPSITCEAGKSGVFKSHDGLHLHYCYYCQSEEKYFVYRCDGGESFITEADDKDCREPTGGSDDEGSDDGGS